MKGFLNSIVEYFRRRPQSRLSLLRAGFLVISSIVTKVTLDTDALLIALAGILGVGDLLLTAEGNTKTTPTSDPKLGAGKEMPPALRLAAEAVAAFLPAPISDLWERHGEGLWDIVKTAEEAMKRPMNPDELKDVRDERL